MHAAEVHSTLEPSAKDLVDKVHEYMETVLWRLTKDVAVAFPRLQNAIKALVFALICDGRAKCFLV